MINSITEYNSSFCASEGSKAIKITKLNFIRAQMMSLCPTTFCKKLPLKQHLSLFPFHFSYLKSKTNNNYYNFSTLNNKSQNLIYVGPINKMVSRMKTFSIGSSLFSAAFAPALIYFSSDHWSLFAKLGLVSTGKI